MDDQIKRISLDLGDEQFKNVNELSNSLGITKAEMIRRAIAVYAQLQNDLQAGYTVGAWRDREHEQRETLKYVLI